MPKSSTIFTGSIFRKVSGYLLLCLAMHPGITTAVSFTSFDARSMAMGGAGVASAKNYNALLFNPALLGRHAAGANRLHGRIYAGARLIDRDNFIDSVDAFQASNNGERLEEEFREFSQRVDAGIDDESDVREALIEAGQVTTAARARLRDYESLSDKPLRVSASAGISLGYAADDRYAMGALIRRNQMGGAVIRFSNEDRAAINTVLDTVDALGGAVELLLDRNDPIPIVTAILTAMRDNVRMPRKEESTSSLEFEGARITETAIGYAPVNSDIHRWHWGTTFKLIEFETIDYEQRLVDAEVADFDDDRNKRRHHNVNFDIGVIRQIDRHWRFGAVLRNIIPFDYRTVRNNTIELRPLMRIGVAYEPTLYTLTADLDITSNDPVGFDPDKRYLSLGSEWRIWRNSALRAGYRYNTVSGSGLYSLGIGLGPRHSHIDIAVAAKGDELGVSLQFAAYF